jgi:hypothetical protein
MSVTKWEPMAAKAARDRRLIANVDESLREGQLSPEQSVRALIALGMAPHQAQERIDLMVASPGARQWNIQPPQRKGTVDALDPRDPRHGGVFT